jgi:hypothetical protein
MVLLIKNEYVKHLLTSNKCPRTFTFSSTENDRFASTHESLLIG